jgi:uncharacterized integral membrane protein
MARHQLSEHTRVSGPRDTGSPRRDALAPATRAVAPASRAWIGITLALVVLVLLIVFIAQNTARTQVSFFGLSGGFPLAVALLVATLAGAILATAIGMTRAAQRRRRARV